MADLSNLTNAMVDGVANGLSASNVTGLNPSAARRNISNFVEISSNACREITAAYRCLYDELSKVWASPNAVKFNSFKGKIREMIRSFTTETNEVARNAISQYNRIASANGAATFSMDLGSLNSLYNGDLGADLIERLNGIAGMDIMSVDSIMNDFRNKITSALGTLNSIPTSLALFDRNASMQTRHYANVSKAKNNVESISNEILKQLQTCIEDEMVKLERASNPSSGQNT